MVGCGWLPLLPTTPHSPTFTTTTPQPHPFLSTQLTTYSSTSVTHPPTFLHPSTTLSSIYLALHSFYHLFTSQPFYSHFASLHPHTHYYYPITYPTIHPPIHSPTHPFTHPSIHPPIHSPTHPFTHPSIHPPIHSPTHSLTHLLTHSTPIHLLLIHSPTHSLTHSFTHPHPTCPGMEFDSMVLKTRGRTWSLVASSEHLLKMQSRCSSRNTVALEMIGCCGEMSGVVGGWVGLGGNGWG